MSKRCAKCEKTVYPTEELKCLDKIWHKACFKCQECNMTLNMKNYKGYNKLPYCNAHYPTTKHTAVADTPEARRIAENTKIQSQIEYHKEFQDAKSKISVVVDTPELRRHLQNTKNISSIEYHKDFEKLKGANYYQIPDTVAMETVRRNTQNISLVKYHEDFERMKGKKSSVVDDPEMMRIKQNTAIQSNVEYHRTRDQLAEMEQKRPAHEQTEPRVRSNPGKISEYDPDINSSGTPYSARNQQARVVYDSNVGKDRNFNARRTSSSSSDPRRVSDAETTRRTSSSSSDIGIESTGSSRRVGSIADYDPMNEQFGSITGQYREPPRSQQPAPQQYQPPPPQPPAQTQDRYAGKGMVCQAMYDYTAADTDEVSFMDGDVIVYCQPIDAGWMEGTVERTGQRGMLPSNYVEPMK